MGLNALQGPSQVGSIGSKPKGVQRSKYDYAYIGQACINLLEYKRQAGVITVLTRSDVFSFRPACERNSNRLVGR